MKLHLPLSLFKAVLSIMMSMSVTVSAASQPASHTMAPTDMEEYVNGSVSFTSSNRCSGELEDYYEISFTGIEGTAVRAGIINLSRNGYITFSGNRGTCIIQDQSSGAIYLDANKELSFKENSSGRAIYSAGRTSICDNGEVELIGNRISGARAKGGAIYVEPGIYLNRNSSLTFSDNRAYSAEGNASDENASASGGAIFAAGSELVEISANDEVSFSNNAASCSNFFNAYSYGGAICADSISITGNVEVSYIKNSASSGALSMDVDAPGSYSYGGAIYVREAGILSLSSNQKVVFSGNRAYSSASYQDLRGQHARASYSYGGAIYGESLSEISIVGNGSVVFEKNAEILSSTGQYRLRGIYTLGNLNLSAPENGEIRFNESLYVNGNLLLNYENNSTGDVIFSGRNTEAHLNEILSDVRVGRTATEEEIQRSRTSEIDSMTQLYGGRLCVEDGAVYQGKGITVHAASNAAVRVKDAVLKHTGNLTLNERTSLELAGDNEISGNVNLLSGSTLIFSGRETKGISILTDNLTIGQDVSIALDSENSWTGENQILMWVRGNLACPDDVESESW